MDVRCLDLCIGMFKHVNGISRSNATLDRALMPSTARDCTHQTFTALHLLQHLKARFPAAKGSSGGHHLFISAFILASKIICDDTYSNKSWCIVGQGMFALWEINQMEQEICSYLEWQLSLHEHNLRAADTYLSYLS